MDQAQLCQCSRPDLWEMGDYRCCVSCGSIAPPNTKVSRKRKAEEAEIVTNDNTRAAPPSFLRTRFIYRPLSHISAFRLLRLFPGSREDELTCEVFHADISDPPDYEAVSYTWGSTALTQKLHTTEGLMQITENCLSALTDLRHVESERILWVDAICISQENNEEKNHQIPLMARIYSNALQVLIHLGGRSTMKDAEALFETLRGARKKPLYRSHKTDMAELLSLPWFSRVWILQEVAMARHAWIIIGSISLDWRHMSIANIQALDLEAKNLAGQVPAVLRISKSDRKPLKDLASLITMARSCLSTDPRDRIYALLGLVHECSGIKLSPDYTRTAQELYTDVTVQFLKAYRSLDFLSDIGIYKGFSQVDVNLCDHLSHIEDIRAELQRTGTELNEVFGYSYSSWGFIRGVCLDLEHVVKTKQTALVDNWKSYTIMPTEQMGFLDLLNDLRGDLEVLLERKIDQDLVREARETFKSWHDRIESTQMNLRKSMFLQSYGTFLIPHHLFAPMSIKEVSMGAIDKIPDLPSWVPNYGQHPQLFSFTHWRPSLFAGTSVARFHSSFQNVPTPSLEVKAIFVNKIQGTDCSPEQNLRLCHEDIPFRWNWKVGSTNFVVEFERSLVELKHGATLDDIRKFSQGRRLALTEASLAIVPASFKLGDVIVVLYGGTVPYLLRPSISSPERFQLLGECYLHGIKGPQFAPNYAELLGYFKDHVNLGAEESELGDLKDPVLRDEKGKENASELSLGPERIHTGSAESKEYGTSDMEQDGLPWKTIFLV